mgnify:CR=1 FL=1
MAKKQISLESVQWIAYMANDPGFANASGEKCKIISGWNSEEVKVANYEIDGYCKVDNVEYALEYDGCYFHGCRKCAQPGFGQYRVSNIFSIYKL